jgi:hypothetical protein
MALITTSAGNQYHITGDFEVKTLLKFVLAAEIHVPLPSSEEGSKAFRICETIVAKAVTVLNAKSFNGQKQVEIELAKVEIQEVLDPSIVGIDQSLVFPLMTDENKEKLALRMRKLQQAVSEKETIETNTTISDVPLDVTEVTNRISDWISKINNLFNVTLAKKVLVDEMSADSAVKAFVELPTIKEALIQSSMSSDLLLSSITQNVRESYTIEF